MFENTLESSTNINELYLLHAEHRAYGSFELLFQYTKEIDGATHSMDVNLSWLPQNV